MSIIYEPKGKALEYAPLAANLYRGCSHGCVYCYAPSATYTTSEKFFSMARARENVIRLLRKDAEKLHGDPRNVLLCFTCDPYQPLNDEHGLTRKAIQTINGEDIPVTILTKGGLRPCRDFDELSTHPGNNFAVTLTTDDEMASLEWEPRAATPKDRIEGLRIAHESGITTWVSFEPVIDPEAVYRMIEATHGFVDLYKIGKLNYHPLAKQIDWITFREKAKAMLESIGKPYLIKKDLATMAA